MRNTLLVVLLAACGRESRDLPALRAAVAEAKVPIATGAATAETSMPSARVVTAELKIDGTAQYAFDTVSITALHDIRIDTIQGQILSSKPAGTGSAACPDSISIAQAIMIAEAQVVGGSVIAAIPDDDVACAREIQVLTAETLWEVKVGGDGTVLEHELSDEGED